MVAKRQKFVSYRNTPIKLPWATKSGSHKFSWATKSSQ
jgi:hypothetical protein